MQAIATITERGKRIGEVLRGTYENLNERERRLVLILGVVLLLFLTVLPVFVLTASVSSLEGENTELRAVIREFNRKGDKLRELAARRKAMTARYKRKPPQLSTFVAEKAQKFGMEVREFSDQPDKKVGLFTKHHVRIKLPNGVGLQPTMKLLEAIDNSPYPIAIERVKIEHYQPGDAYNGIEVDVISFERGS